MTVPSWQSRHMHTVVNKSPRHYLCAKLRRDKKRDSYTFTFTTADIWWKWIGRPIHHLSRWALTCDSIIEYVYVCVCVWMYIHMNIGRYEFSRMRGAARHGRTMITRKTWNDRFTEIVPRQTFRASPVIISDAASVLVHLHIKHKYHDAHRVHLRAIHA